MAERVNCVSDDRYKMKAVIEFLTREGHIPKEIFTRLKNIYGDQVFDISTVRYWARESKRNWIQLTDRDHPGHPELRNSTEICQKIDEKICKNRRITQRALLGSLSTWLGTMNKFAQGL